MQDLLGIIPLSIVTAAGLLTLLAESVSRKSLTAQWWVALAGLAASGLAGWGTIQTPGEVFSGMISSGGSSGYWSIVFSAGGMLCVLLSRGYLLRQQIEHGEFYTLLLFGVAGMMLMAGAADLIIFFLGLELMSVSFYVLAGFARKRMASNEAALKYFLLGAFATGFLLYGIALLYGATGTTHIATIVQAAGAHQGGMLLTIGLALVLIGLSFKIAAVPFHMWVPDVYEGAPTTVSAFMSTAGKAAAFSGILLIFAPALVTAQQPVRDVLAAVAALSMIVGNVLAVSQTSIKRMLAYSSIAHAGYILSGVVAANTTGSTGVMYYLLAYTLMNAGAFGVLALEESERGSNLTFDEYSGFGLRKPLLAGLMALFMFSLAGVPPFAGFFGKYYVFAGAIQGGYTWLAILGVVMSVVSAYYYLRLVVVMYFREGSQGAALPAPVSGMVALVAAALALVELGIMPSTVLNITRLLF